MSIVVGDQMLVLDTAGIARYEQRDSKWQKAEAVAWTFHRYETLADA